YSFREIEELITARGAGHVSASYVQQLRAGKKTDPKVSVLDSIARVFGVAPGYFLAGETAEHVLDQLEEVVLARDTGARRVALRYFNYPPKLQQVVDGV